MILIFTIIFLSLIFLGIAFGINKKNAKYLLAGYNTMSAKEQENFNLDGFLIFFKKYWLQVALYSTLIFLILLLFINPEVAIIGYTLAVIIPIPYLIKAGNKFKN